MSEPTMMFADMTIILLIAWCAVVTLMFTLHHLVIKPAQAMRIRQENMAERMRHDALEGLYSNIKLNVRPRATDANCKVTRSEIELPPNDKGR